MLLGRFANSGLIYDGNVCGRSSSMPNMRSRGGSRFSNRSDARTDKYSYFNDNAAKTCDDTTMIKHEPETKPCRGFFSREYAL